MKKKVLILFALILILILPSALAENTAVYTPGKVTEALFADAFNRGDMVTLNMQFDLDLSENAGELYGEDADALAAISQVLENSIFSLGAAKIDDGLRVMLKGDYTVDAQTAYLDAALDLTKTGVALSSSLLPGEQITANWETLLALAELSEEEIAAIMSLRDTDIEVLIAELITALEPMLEMAMQIAAPYSETIMAHIAGLPMVINENVPAEAGYPTAAAEMQIQITDKAIGDLISALAAQLKQDATLCAMIDMLLAETATDDTPALTTVQLCDAIIEVVSEEFTDESLPYNVFIGMDADGNLLYLNLSKGLEDGTIALVSFISGQLEETGANLINLDILALTADQDILDGFSLVTAYTIDAANPNVISAEFLFSAYAEGAEVAAISLSTNNIVNPENPNAYDGMLSMAMDAADGEAAVSMGMDANIYSLCTEAGEEMLIEGSLAITADDEDIQSVFEGTLMTELDGSTPVTVMTESIQMPQIGIAQWSETYTLTAAPQTAGEALTVTALETASQEALDALGERILANFDQLENTLDEMLQTAFAETAD